MDSELIKKIEQFEKEHKSICFFGQKEYNCPHIGGDYCISGECEKCEYYQKQLERLRLISSNS